jgi:hypothetical protein
MAAALRAGIAYFALVFAAGVALGALRVLALAPVLGATGAVLVELPVILAVAWLACGRLTARIGVPAAPAPRAAMGGVAFLLLLGAEAGLGAAVFGQPLAVQVAALARPAGALGLAGQVAFGLLPLARIRR